MTTFILMFMIFSGVLYFDQRYEHRNWGIALLMGGIGALAFVVLMKLVDLFI